MHWLKFNHLSQLDLPTHISRMNPFPNLGVLDGIFANFDKSLYNKKPGYLDRTLRYALSDLGLHLKPMSHKKDARLIWANQINN